MGRKALTSLILGGCLVAGFGLGRILSLENYSQPNESPTSSPDSIAQNRVFPLESQTSYDKHEFPQYSPNSQNQSYNPQKPPQELSLENAIYSSLISTFGDLEGVKYRGGEEHFKGKVFTDLSGLTAEGVLAAYDEKLKILPDKERRELADKYSQVIDLLKRNKNKGLEELGKSNGYLPLNDTADIVWPLVKSNWQNSQIGEIFVDVIDNDQLPEVGLEAFLSAASTYCTSVGKPGNMAHLEEKIRTYQREMPYCNAIQTKMNAGTATDEEKQRMQAWIKLNGEIDSEFGNLTSRDDTKTKMNQELSRQFSAINPLYGLAMEVVGLQ